ncbi:MAG: ExeA family protein [Candidatus Cryptobacteroides sp.]
MNRTPFGKDIEIEHLMRSENFSETLSRLKYAAQNSRFAILTAPPGCGKSTVVRALRHELDPRKTMFIYVSQSQLTPRWLYNDILSQVGGGSYYFRGEARKALHQRFAAIREIEGRDICVCVDEAHLLTLETIQELRFFLNFDIDSKSIISLILVGQDELRVRLRAPQFEAIRQRIDIVAQLNRMTMEQTARYVRTHMEYAGETGNDLFSPEALETIHNCTKGIPRCVNTLCTLLLSMAHSNNLSVIDSSTVALVAANETIF